jgi:L-asparaginase
MSIAILTIGGTIDKDYFDALSEYQIVESPINDFFSAINLTLDYHLTSLMKKDSLDMTEEDRAAIYKHIDGIPEKQILITHGTDTMSITADSLKPIKNKTIVITGAMKPARFKETDAIFNIGFALGALQALPCGIYIAMSGKIFPAGTVKKNRELGRFEEK